MDHALLLAAAKLAGAIAIWRRPSLVAIGRFIAIRAERAGRRRLGDAIVLTGLAELAVRVGHLIVKAGYNIDARRRHTEPKHRKGIRHGNAKA